MTPILFALIAATGFFGASLLAGTGLGRSARLQQVSMVIAAAVLLGVTFADLIPDALEHATPIHVAFAMAAGFLVLYVVESLSGAHTHHHEPHAHVHGHGHGHAPNDSQSGAADAGDCVPMHAVTPFLIGLALHNFTDGVVIGVGDDASGSAMGAIALGILIHQLPVGLSFAAVLTAAGRRGASLLRATVGVAAMIPLGALVYVLLPDLSAAATDTLLAVAAGALLYVSTGHLLPEAHSEERHFAVVLTFVAALLATIAFIAVA
jgi:zinc transporter ZupT